MYISATEIGNQIIKFLKTIIDGKVKELDKRWFHSGHGKVYRYVYSILTPKQELYKLYVDIKGTLFHIAHSTVTFTMKGYSYMNNVQNEVSNFLNLLGYKKINVEYYIDNFKINYAHSEPI